MTVAQCEKKAFVQDKLKPLLIAARLDIKDVIYEAGNGNGEWITISYTNGHTVKCNVSGDSHIALVRDTVKDL